MLEYWVQAPLLSLPPKWDVLGLYIFSLSCMAMLSTESCPPLFPKAVRKNSGTLNVSSTALPAFWRSNLRVCAFCQSQKVDGIAKVHAGSWDLRVIYGGTFVAYVGTCGMPGVQVNAGQLVGFAVSPSVGSMYRQACWVVVFVCGLADWWDLWVGWLTGSTGQLARPVE